MKGQHYQAAGVDIAAGQQTVDAIKSAVQATYGAEVLAGIGAFGGLYDASALKALAAPVLVASTDGVGTKVKVAARLRRWDTVGQDLVNHCINDILVQGAKPLFFLDYIATSKLDPAIVAAIVGGIAEACQGAGIALLGGETAEMPGVYQTGEIDLAGTIVGLVDRANVIDGSQIQAADVIIGLGSSGLHTNGFSLARHILDDLDWEVPQAALEGASIGHALLAVHRSYLKPIQALQAADIPIHGLCHITGGGIVDNLPRILPAGLGAKIALGTWPIPPIFSLLAQTVEQAECYQVFNMGLGMLVVLPADQAQSALHLLPDDSFIVGEIIPNAAGVSFA